MKKERIRELFTTAKEIKERLGNKGVVKATLYRNSFDSQNSRVEYVCRYGTKDTDWNWIDCDNTDSVSPFLKEDKSDFLSWKEFLSLHEGDVFYIPVILSAIGYHMGCEHVRIEGNIPNTRNDTMLFDSMWNLIDSIDSLSENVKSIFA